MGRTVVKRALPPALLAGSVLFFVTACGMPPDRVVRNPEQGYEYRAPEGWNLFDEELRSRTGTLFTVKVLSLEDAKHDFLEGLPRSMLPEVENWTKYYFVVDGAAEIKDSTLGGEPAVEVTYRVRVRPQDPPGTAIYWVARRGIGLYVLRVVFTPNPKQDDMPAVREILDSWRFVEPSGGRPLEEGGPPTIEVPEA